MRDHGSRDNEPHVKVKLKAQSDCEPVHETVYREFSSAVKAALWVTHIHAHPTLADPVDRNISLKKEKKHEADCCHIHD